MNCIPCIPGSGNKGEIIHRNRSDVRKLIDDIRRRNDGVQRGQARVHGQARVPASSGGSEGSRLGQCAREGCIDLFLLGV